MARGDMFWFNAALYAAFNGAGFSLGADTLRLGIVTSTPTPSENTPDPRWGSGGTTNLSANQVSTGTGYTGPITLGSPTWALTSNVPTLDANDISIPQDASTGFTNGYYAVVYDANASNRALGYLDLGGPVGNANGPLTITWNTGGLFTDVAV